MQELVADHTPKLFSHMEENELLSFSFVSYTYELSACFSCLSLNESLCFHDNHVWEAWNDKTEKQKLTNPWSLALNFTYHCSLQNHLADWVS
jgi:hypothetical protein